VRERLTRLESITLLTKLVALAESTDFVGERRAARSKAWRLAARTQIRQLRYRGRLYVFDPTLHGDSYPDEEELIVGVAEREA